MGWKKAQSPYKNCKPRLEKKESIGSCKHILFNFSHGDWLFCVCSLLKQTSFEIPTQWVSNRVSHGKSRRNSAAPPCARAQALPFNAPRRSRHREGPSQRRGFRNGQVRWYLTRRFITGLTQFCDLSLSCLYYYFNCFCVVCRYGLVLWNPSGRIGAGNGSERSWFDACKDRKRA